MTYFEELSRAMKMLEYDPRTIFMGQAVAFPGTAMRRTLEGVHSSRLLELPVTEDMQMGMAVGMALDGALPVCIYPRWNFLLLATNQLVLHLDKIKTMTGGKRNPRVIIRTAVAAQQPLDPGPQHVGDFSEQYARMLKTVTVVALRRPDEIVPAYGDAMMRAGSTILVERSELY